jgi:hypothetical protein
MLVSIRTSIRLLYFQVCFPAFRRFVYNCCVMDPIFHSHKSCPSTLAHLSHHSSGTPTSLFTSVCLVTVHFGTCEEDGSNMWE